MAVTKSTQSAPRRNQAERSATTRQALLDATLECLVQDGYANTTTARVAERAGVSRGAHLHHFQTRDALLAAAAEHLTLRRGEKLLEAADALPSGPDRVARGLDLLWESYANPLYQATLDLWTHGRTDAELRQHLIPIERQLDRQTMELSRRLFPTPPRVRTSSTSSSWRWRPSAGSSSSTRCTPAGRARPSSGRPAAASWSRSSPTRTPRRARPGQDGGQLPPGVRTPLRRAHRMAP